MSGQNWQKIYLDYSPKLLRICRRYITDLTTAEDIVQDSFIAALQKENHLKNNEALFAWLKKIVINNALQHIRKTQNSKVISTESENIPDTYTEMAHTFIDEQKHILSYQFSREQLLQSIDSLPSQYKTVFNLYYIDQHSHAEISRLLEIPVNTSKSHLLRAKKALQIYLKTHFVNNDSKKDRKFLILLFFGFSNLVWAKTYRSSFADYSIAPSKNFILPERNFHKSFTGKKSKIINQKILLTGTAVLLTFGSVFFFKPVFQIKNESKTTITVNAVPEKKNFSEDIKREKTPEEKQILSLEINNEKPVKKLEIEAKKENENSPTAIQNDDSEPVIVVKKIIQRDTVFIER